MTVVMLLASVRGMSPQEEDNHLHRRDRDCHVPGPDRHPVFPQYEDKSRYRWHLKVSYLRYTKVGLSKIRTFWMDLKIDVLYRKLVSSPIFLIQDECTLVQCQMT